MKTVLAILPMGNGLAQAALSGIRAEAAGRRTGLSVKAWKAAVH